MLFCAKLLSHVRLFGTPWPAARQAPLSMGILQAVLERVAAPSSSGPMDSEHQLASKGSPRSLSAHEWSGSAPDFKNEK